MFLYCFAKCLCYDAKEKVELECSKKLIDLSASKKWQTSFRRTFFIDFCIRGERHPWFF